MKKNPGFVLFFLLLAALAQPGFSQAGNFDWTLQFLKSPSGEAAPVDQVIRMRNGESFVINIDATANCYCYVICYDANRNIFVLANQGLRAQTKLSTDPVSVTDPTGTETIFVILSSARQTKLEGFIKSQHSNPKSRRETDQLYYEMVNLQKAASSLGEPAEVFIPSGGTTRGALDTSSGLTRFSGSNNYVRSIRILH
jgi:hypothetical protein